jgi:hypothetical protein
MNGQSGVLAPNGRIIPIMYMGKKVYIDENSGQVVGMEDPMQGMSSQTQNAMFQGGVPGGAMQYDSTNLAQQYQPQQQNPLQLLMRKLGLI